MERPNYRLDGINTSESTGRVVSAVGLRKNSGNFEDKTFCFWNNPHYDGECLRECTSHCSCEPDCKRHCYCDNDQPKCRKDCGCDRL